MSIQRITAICICTSVWLWSTAAAFACDIVQTDKTLQPAKWAAITNTPFEASDSEAYLMVYMEVSGETLVVPAYTNGKDGFEFMTGASYAKPWETKPIDSFWLTDGDVGCELKGYSHGAMEKAPGALDRLIFSSYINARGFAASMGIPASEIDAPADGKPNRPELTAVFEIATAYNELQDLKTQAQFDSDLANDFAVISAYLYASPMFRNTVAQSDNMAEIFDAAQEWEQQRPRKTMQFYPMQSSPMPSSQGLIDTDFLRPILRGAETDFSEVKTAAELSRRMIAYQQSQNDIKVGQIRDNAGTALGVSSVLVSHLKPVLVLMGHAVFFQTITDKLVVGMYPSSFSSISLDGGPYILRKNAHPSSGSVKAINVVAQAKGLDTAKIALDVAINFVPFGDAAKAIGKTGAKTAAKTVPGRVVRRLNVSKNISVVNKIERASASDTIEPYAKQVMSSLLGSLPDGMIIDGSVIRPFKIGPINILEPGYHKSSINNEQVLDWDPQPHVLNYTAARRGGSDLNIKTHPRKFGGESAIISKHITVDKNLGLKVTPALRKTIPANTAYFEVEDTALFEDEEDVRPVVELSDSRHIISSIDGPFYKIMGDEKRVMWNISIDTSPYPNAFPVRVTASRARDSQTRASGTIELPEISPQAHCVEQGQQERFSVRDESGDPMTNFIWEVEGEGRIKKSGLYTAPKKAKGKVEIIAKSKIDGREFDRVSFNLGCACEWSLSAGGETTSGSRLSVSSLGMSIMSNYNIMTLDGESSLVTISGQGHPLMPETTSSTIMIGGTEYMSGLPISLIVPGQDDDKCAMPKTNVKYWYFTQGRWLVGAIDGRIVTTKDLASGCPQRGIPFSFEFKADMGANKERLEDVAKRLKDGEIMKGGKKARDMVSFMANAGMDVSACLGVK